MTCQPQPFSEAPWGGRLYREIRAGFCWPSGCGGGCRFMVRTRCQGGPGSTRGCHLSILRSCASGSAKPRCARGWASGFFVTLGPPLWWLSPRLRRPPRLVAAVCQGVA